MENIGLLRVFKFKYVNDLMNELKFIEMRRLLVLNFNKNENLIPIYLNLDLRL